MRSNATCFDDFVLDPRDNHMLTAMSGCVCGGPKLQKYSVYNIGYKKGRMATFPKHSLKLNIEMIAALADAGLYWDYNSTRRGRIRCVGCGFVEHYWTDPRKVLRKHLDKSSDENNWFMCAILGARELKYTTEVDILYDKDTQKRSPSFQKPTDPTRFEIDPRDYRLMDLGVLFDDGTCNGRFDKERSDRNVGRMMGRYNSFPQHSIDYVDDIMQLVESGFYWFKDLTFKNPRAAVTVTLNVCVSAPPDSSA